MESILLAELSKNKSRILFERNSNFPRYSASLVKVFYAIEFIKLLQKRAIKNRTVFIKDDDLEGYGTDVLSDIVRGQNVVKIDGITLMGLMLKYSCNSSSSVLTKNFLPKRKGLQVIARKEWGFVNATLVSKKGKAINFFSLQHFLTLFQFIYSRKGKYWDYLKSKLRTSRNIYYLFDQLELDILGVKSGTAKYGKYYWINNCGVFRLKGKNYFIGAMVSNTSISKAVIRIREIGRELVNKLKVEN